MTSIQITSLAILAGILAVSILRKINIGIAALTATLVLCVLGHVSAADAIKQFPASLVILIIGVTLLFAHADRSGAVTWLVTKALAATGGRAHVMPWLGFGLGAALSTIGAFPTAPISLLLPILAHIARTRGLNYVSMAVVCVLGSNAAGVSPLSPAGALLKTIAEKAHVSYSPWEVYAVFLGMHVILAAAILAITGVKAAVPAERVPVVVGGPAASPEPLESTPVPRPVNQRYLIASLIALVAFVLITVVFRLDVGLTAVTLAFLLQLAFRPPEAELLQKVPWNVVLLLGGLVIYLGMLDTVGTLHSIEKLLGGIDAPVLLIIVVAYLTAVISNMESSTLGVLGVMPVALSVTGHSSIGATAVMIAVTMAGAVVVMSPMHIAGALIIGNTPYRDQTALFRRLLIWPAVLTLIVPPLACLYPILNG